MEVLRSLGSTVKSQEDEERVLKFLEKVGPTAWPVLYSIWQERRRSPAGDLTQYFIDNVENPTCFLEKKRIESEGSAGGDGSVEGDIKNWKHYIHITLCAPPDTNKDRLVAALDELRTKVNLPDWSAKLLFPFLGGGFWPEVMKRAKLNGGAAFGEGESRIYSLRQDRSSGALTPQAAAQPSLPPSYAAHVLNAVDAHTINKHWKYGGSQRTLDYISRNINENCPGGSVGIFVKNPELRTESPAMNGANPAQEDIPNAGCVEKQCRGQLVAWGLVTTYGGIGMVQTLPQFRRRGLAQVVVSILSQALRSLSLPVFCCIEDDNAVSVRCFQKAGFELEPDSRLQWIHYFPANCTPIDFLNKDSSSGAHAGTCTWLLALLCIEHNASGLTS